MSLLCHGNQDKSCVAQASSGAELEVIRNRANSWCHFFLAVLSFVSFSLGVLTSSVCGSSWLFIEWYLRHQFPYHLKDPEPSPSDLAFYGRNCSFLWNRILSSWSCSGLFSSGSSVHPLVTWLWQWVIGWVKDELHWCW